MRCARRWRRAAPTSARCICLAQAERRAGDLDAAEAAARRLIAQNSRNPRGYSALAEALEERRRYQAVVDALAPAMATFRSSAESAIALSMLLPHLGFAYQQLGQHDKAIVAFEEARKICAGRSGRHRLSDSGADCGEELPGRRRAGASGARRSSRRSAACAARGAGASSDGQGRSGHRPARRSRCSGSATIREAHIALAQVYAEANRGAQAVKLLQEAQAQVPRRDLGQLRARGGAREAEEVCGGGGRVSAGAHARSGARARAELSRLHAGRTRRAPGRVGRADQARAQVPSRTTARISTAWAGPTSRAARSIWRRRI